MWTKNEPRLKNELECDVCKTHIMDPNLSDLHWSEACMNLNEPFIVCPVCNNKIWNVLDSDTSEIDNG